MAAAIVVSVGGLTLVGWALGVDPLESFLPPQVSMKANTALGFVLGGSALGLLWADWASGRARPVGLACAIAALVLGALTLSEYLLGWDLGIDQALARDLRGTPQNMMPGRMAPNTVLNFVLVGSALLLLETRRGRRGAVALVVVSAFVSALALTGHAYGMDYIYVVASYSAMAPHTAAMFLVLDGGMLAARPLLPMTEIVTRQSAGGAVARRLLIAAVVVPLALGFLVLQGQRAGGYDQTLAYALVCLISVVALAALTLMTAHWIDRTELERGRADKALELERAKSEFIATISHELRTPLTSIKGYVALLLEGDAGELEEDQREFLQIVGRNAERLVALVNDLLDISRLESGGIQLEREALDLARVVREVATSLQPQITAKGQHLELTIADPLPAVYADANRVAQIVANLMSNAHKYTPAGGDIQVTVSPRDGQMRVSIRDSGIGLSADEQAQLFTRFFRAKNRVTEEVGGTGLGLAITRSLVELHGGQISVTSAPGLGSTFTFTLPLAPSQPSDSSRFPEERLGKRILIVDDEPDITYLLGRYLDRGGYRVVCVGSAAEAIRVAHAEHPDLIVLDILLPDADGYRVMEILQVFNED